MSSDVDDDQVQFSDAQTILDSITDAFFSLNADWEFSYVNRQTEIVLGHKASELLAKSIWEVFPGTVGSEFERVYRQAAQDQVAASFCSYYPDHDRWYDVNVYPANGALSVYFRDVTARVKDELRREALFKLSDFLRDLHSPEEIIYKSSEIVGTVLGVSRVGYGTIAPFAETMHVFREWNAAGVKPLAETLDLRGYGSFIDDLKAGKFVSIDDVDNDFRTLQAATALKERHAGAFINVPIIEQNQLVAVVYVNNAQARQWLPEELAFIKEVADRTRTASERQRNEQELAKLSGDSASRRRLYEAFLENSPDLAYVFDLNHRFAYANKVLLGMWNRTWEEAIGKTCLELGYEPWHAEMHEREIDQVIATKRPIRGEVPFDGAYGRRIYEYIFTPVLTPNGDVEAIAGTTRDVTDRKQAEEALAEANRRKDEFLAMLAHELRNPLAPISAAAELLDNFSLDEKLRKSTTQIIIRQVKHMNALVDDLLDVSRVTRGLVNLNSVSLDLHSVVYDAVEQVRPSIGGRSHRLRLDLGTEAAHVLGDHKRLIQIVANLLDNAVKYTSDGGEIDIVLKINEASVELSVADNGIGIAADLQPRIFELFTQGERTSDRVQGGLGIGLALVKTLTEMHGGELSCFSLGQGHGSRFTVRLPRHLVAENLLINGTNATLHAATVAKPLRILVVDDNVDAATVLALYLEASGHHVLVEHSSTTALARAVLEQPDVCILDIGLPEMDGNQLARQLKAEQKTSRALLIALTGYSQEQDRIKAQMAGFDQFFVKPVDPNRLLDLLIRHKA